MAWKHSINLNQVIADVSDKYDLSRLEDTVPSEVVEAIASEIVKAPPLVRFESKVRKCKTIAEMNRILQAVFDECDRGRQVWCGFAI